MYDWIELKDVRHPHYPHDSLDDWHKIFTPKFCIFYMPHAGDRYGFVFLCIERITFSTHDENWADDEQSKYSWYGIAYFDGLRHIFLSDNGYLNYPDIDMQIEILTELKKLDEKYCRE